MRTYDEVFTDLIKRHETENKAQLLGGAIQDIVYLEQDIDKLKKRVEHWKRCFYKSVGIGEK